MHGAAEGLLVRARFFATVAVTLFLDLATKVWALRTLANGPLRYGRVNFVLAHNPHGAMGLLRQLPTDARRALLVSTGIVASIAIVLMARRAPPVARFGLGLILGGALGNVIDRALAGSVVDFIDVMLTPSFHWHTFNVADVAVVAGAALVALGTTSAHRAAVSIR